MVVSNTSPLNYLVQIGAAHLLPALHGAVHVPQAVVDELADAEAPQTVRAWIASPPVWLIVHADSPTSRPEWANIHRGEAAAIALALDEGASLLLVDDLDGRIAARAAGGHRHGYAGRSGCRRHQTPSQLSHPANSPSGD